MLLICVFICFFRVDCVALDSQDVCSALQYTNFPVLSDIIAYIFSCRIGAHEHSPSTFYMWTSAIIFQILLFQPYSWVFMGAASLLYIEDSICKQISWFSLSLKIYHHPMSLRCRYHILNVSVAAACHVVCFSLSTGPLWLFVIVVAAQRSIFDKELKSTLICGYKDTD